MTEQDETNQQMIMKKIDVEIFKIMAETRHINIKTFLYPVVVAAGLMAAGGTIVKYMLI